MPDEIDCIPIEPLIPDTFAPFGDVLEESAAKEVMSINKGTTSRFHAVSTLSHKGGKLGVSLFRTTTRKRPIQIDMLECHPLGSQSFIPVTASPWLVVVALGNEETPYESGVRCFMASAAQGVTYHPGTWHHPLLVLDEEQDFWVIDRLSSDSEPEGANLKEHLFATPKFIEI